MTPCKSYLTKPKIFDLFAPIRRLRIQTLCPSVTNIVCNDLLNPDHKIISTVDDMGKYRLVESISQTDFLSMYILRDTNLVFYHAIMFLLC